MTVLSVNLNKIAVLRNSRGGSEPSVIAAADTVIAAGCSGVTVHPRPDLRHIWPEDVIALAKLCRGRVEFNIEGNPFAPANDRYPGLMALVEATRPEQVTLVPDSDAQLTSDHGFDLQRDQTALRPLIAQFKACGSRVSLFLDAGAPNLGLAAEIGADRIELYTGPYAQAFASGDAGRALADCARTAELAQSLGLGVNAGHDLNQVNLGPFLQAVTGVLEVSIGHALIAEALYSGLHETVRAYLRVLGRA